MFFDMEQLHKITHERTMSGMFSCSILHVLRRLYWGKK